MLHLFQLPWQLVLLQHRLLLLWQQPVQLLA
jgi:hypothetical protein